MMCRVYASRWLVSFLLAGFLSGPLLPLLWLGALAGWLVQLLGKLGR
jgi:hypothetical protein